MKLELKHLAPYLPYGLKGYCTDDMQGEEVFLGIEIKKRQILLITDKLPMDLEYFKPILRPLSDLTKEIEVNGEKFVPRKILISHFDFYYSDLNKYDLDKWEYRVVDKLLEWHFDIYGLIENGLAININTLNYE
jgi:hypothetical protein